MPVYIDHLGDGRFPTHHWPAVRVEGQAVAAVRAFVPSIVAPAEPFAVAVRSEDKNVRVRQLDGAMARSSPIWIGGEESR